MKSHRIPLVLIVTTLALLLTPLGGCPAPGGDANSLSTLPFVKTAIPVRFDASLKVGTDLIVFGPGALTGVSYVVPATHPTAGTAVPGAPRSVGFAVAGKKVAVFDSTGQLSILDAQIPIPLPVALPTNQILLDTLPTDENEDFLSPVVADGNLLLTRNDVNSIAHALKVIDLSTLSGTSLNNLPRSLSVAGRQVAISATDQKVVTFAGDSFFVYDLTAPTADPREIDLSEKGGIQGPFAFGGTHILYVADTTTDNMRLLSLADTTETPTVLSKNPGNPDRGLAIHGGTFAYFLNRNALDQYASSAVSSDVVYRAAFGAVPGTTLSEGGVAGANPADHTPPWAGYGDEVAITPTGSYIFISGNNDIDVNAEFLQVSTGGAFLHFADGTGFLNATDVDASATLVGFKTGSGETTTLGYIVLP